VSILVDFSFRGKFHLQKKKMDSYVYLIYSSDSTLVKAQIRTRLWVRNAFAIRGRLFHYRGYILCRTLLRPRSIHPLYCFGHTLHRPLHFRYSPPLQPSGRLFWLVVVRATTQGSIEEYRKHGRGVILHLQHDLRQERECKQASRPCIRLHGEIFYTRSQRALIELLRPSQTSGVALRRQSTLPAHAA
jgi:hypothetical protein